MVCGSNAMDPMMFLELSDETIGKKLEQILERRINLSWVDRWTSLLYISGSLGGLPYLD